MMKRSTILKCILLVFVLCAMSGAVFAGEVSAVVTRIVSDSDRTGRAQIFFSTGEEEEKQLALRGGEVHRILQSHIVEGGGVVYHHEGILPSDFTSDRLIAVIKPDGSTTSVLDLFPSFSQQALRVSFPYAFEKRLQEQTSYLQ